MLLKNKKLFDFSEAEDEGKSERKDGALDPHVKVENLDNFEPTENKWEDLKQSILNDFSDESNSR